MPTHSNNHRSTATTNHRTNHRNHDSPYCRHAQSQHILSPHSITTNNPAKSYHPPPETAKASLGKRPATSNKVERWSTTGYKRPAERDTPSSVSGRISPEGGGNEEGEGKGKREWGATAHGGEERQQGKGEKEKEEIREGGTWGEEAARPPKQTAAALGFLGLLYITF
ncbi:hypothetical protein RHMOL_Rhmol06G0275500 [Rhododendron molle]|uniref:Uncharacterized protein n=1 Tax=Rhododendron molle TaxID=49168 RepID=A0ACC0NGS4_RHOML|nr:hypothetical protein RHMOL_Rhmol06G0275500 [Rhododendron molle]